jgi:hypothetical protein
MKVFESLIYDTTTANGTIADVALPLALGDVKNTTRVVVVEGSPYPQPALQISSDILEGTETYTYTRVVSDDALNEQIIKARVSDAQAGYIVVGVAPKSVVESEFDNYTMWAVGYETTSGDIANNATVVYRGVLKVSKTQVYTPAFLSTANAQFLLK